MTLWMKEITVMIAMRPCWPTPSKSKGQCCAPHGDLSLPSCWHKTHSHSERSCLCPHGCWPCHNGCTCTSCRLHWWTLVSTKETRSHLMLQPLLKQYQPQVSMFLTNFLLNLCLYSFSCCLHSWFSHTRSLSHAEDNVDEGWQVVTTWAMVNVFDFFFLFIFLFFFLFLPFHIIDFALERGHRITQWFLHSHRATLQCISSTRLPMHLELCAFNLL